MAAKASYEIFLHGNCVESGGFDSPWQLADELDGKGVGILTHSGITVLGNDYALVIVVEADPPVAATVSGKVQLFQSEKKIGTFDLVGGQEQSDLDGVPCYTAEVSIGGAQATLYVVPSPDMRIHCA